MAALAAQVTPETEMELRGEALAEARKMVDGIRGVLSLLGDLDGINPGEPDVVRFDEITALFTDIGDFAAYAACAVRRIADTLRLAQDRT